MSLTICLNMIVKNEGHIIADTLKNICSYIDLDYWVICDTGSTDNTKEEITKFFKTVDISGELHEEEWKGFAYNRTKAVQLAENKGDFLLFFDADDRIVGDFKIDKSELKLGYSYYFKYGTTIHWRRLGLVDNSCKWSYKGVVHEVHHQEKPCINIMLEGDYYIHTNYVVGNRNINPIKKFQNDAKDLVNAIKSNKDPEYYNRYHFYTGESYRFAEMYDESIKYYIKTTKLNGWTQEKYWSCYWAGRLLMEKKNKTEEAFYYFLLSYEFDPTRWECFYTMIKHYRTKNQHKVAYGLYKLLREMTEPFENKLFIMKDIHDHLLYFELTIILYYVKDYEASVDVFKKLFSNKKLPKHLVSQVAKNFTFYEKHFDKTQPKIEELYMLKKEFDNRYLLSTNMNDKIMVPNKVSFWKNNNENGIEKYKDQEQLSKGIDFDISQEIKKEVENEIKSHDDDNKIKLTVTEKIN